MLTALWRYRYFVLSSIRGEFKGRFVRSQLGMAWSILHPLAQAAIFALVLAEVIGARLTGFNDNIAAYPMYLMSGLAAWSLFSEILNRCLTVFIDYSGTMKKILFPRICLPIIIWGSALVNHFLLLGAIIVVFAFFGQFPGVTWLILPLGIVLISIFAFGLGLLLGIVNVFSRDVSQFMTVVMQLWFWLTPIIYLRENIPSYLVVFLDLNPMTALVGLYHDAMLFERWPSISELVVPTLTSLALLAISFVVFRRASPELVDVL